MRSSCPSWGKWAFVLVVLLSEAFQTLCIHQQKTFFRQALAGHLIFVLQLEKFGPEKRHGSWTQSRKPATKTWDPTEHDKNCSRSTSSWDRGPTAAEERASSGCENPRMPLAMEAELRLQIPSSPPLFLRASVCLTF